MLTPEDIEQRTFSTALRGYDLNEVDDFLDEVMATIRSLQEQLEEARARQGSAPAVAAPAEPSVAPDESAVGRALIAAQEAADKIVAEATAEAERIKEQARIEAESWESERDAARAAAEREMAELSERVHAVRRELAHLASNVADSLDQMDAAIAGVPGDAVNEDDDADGPVARHVAADDEIDWGEDDGGSGESPDDEFGSDDDPGSSEDTPDDSPDDDEDGSPDLVEDGEADEDDPDEDDDPSDDEFSFVDRDF